MAPSDTRFFTEAWAITVPSHPNVKFIHLTPEHHDEYIKLDSNPLNRPFSDPLDKIWTEERKQEVKRRLRERYILSKTKYRALDLLVQVNGKSVGGGGVYEIPDVVAGLANVGLLLEESVRGMGLGKAMFQVLLRLSNELDIDVVGAGTMKANKPMRALAASLGLEEKEEIVKVPGRGVLAELIYITDQTKWKDFKINVEFKGPAPE
jgi:RimJ/RimL family protein N-acetyltransferase